MNADVLRMLANAVATVELPPEVAGKELAVIFDNAYLFVDMASGVESSAPAATVLEEDMPEAMRVALDDGDQVVLIIRGKCYTVAEPKPDGTGVSVLRLRK